MAKKLNKMMARLEALEKAVAGLFMSKPVTKKRKAKKAQKAEAVKKKLVKKSRKASRPRNVAKKAIKARKATAPKSATRAPMKKVVAVVKVVPKPTSKKAAKRKAVHIPPPSLEQLVPSGEPDFVSPHEQV